MQYAADKTGYQRAYGGATGGDIATNLHAADDPGLPEVRPVPARRATSRRRRQGQGRAAACGQPNGFSTNIAYRAERPKEKATAEALQQSLAKVGIKLTIKPYPPGDYFKLYAGKPDFAKANNARPAWSTAGAPTGRTASASCSRSSTAG